VLGLLGACVLLITMRQNVRLLLLQHQISELRLQRASLRRDLQERGYFIAARTQFERMAPEIQELQLGSAASDQVLSLAALPEVAPPDRSLSRAVLDFLAGIGEVRAAHAPAGAGAAPEPAPPDAASDASADPDDADLATSGGLW
jgi:hypothetical protein